MRGIFVSLPSELLVPLDSVVCCSHGYRVLDLSIVCSDHPYSASIRAKGEDLQRLWHAVNEDANERQQALAGELFNMLQFLTG